MSELFNSAPGNKPAANPTGDATATMAQLQAAVCGLGAMVLVLSLAFNIFVWKQNRNISAMTNGRAAQLAQLQTNVKKLTGVATELANYSEGRPELMAIFKRYGIDLKSVPSASKP
jgi:hypothetical protein